MLVQERPYTSPDIVRFLKHLLRHIPGKLLVIWDGAPIHRGQPVKDFLAQGGARRIRLEPFPGYAPDLNPDEPWWKVLRSLALKGRRFNTWGEIAKAVADATAYWNAHRHPFAWGRRRRHKLRRQTGVARLPSVA